MKTLSNKDKEQLLKGLHNIENIVRVGCVSKNLDKLHIEQDIYTTMGLLCDITKDIGYEKIGDLIRHINTLYNLGVEK